jgi:predicted porin
MKKLALLILIALSISAANAQNAKSLLNEVSAKVKSYDNIQINFKYNLNNAKENVNQDTRGDVTLSGDKYILNMLGTTRMFDGKKYTLLFRKMKK